MVLALFDYVDTICSEQFCYYAIIYGEIKVFIQILYVAFVN